ncbi:MAG: manganese efflux pump MntP family protein [Candidatus Coproplasma sp.]
MWVLILEVFLIGVSLSMDAFAVSICDGMVYGDLNKRKGAVIPVTFGVFQAAMPLIGFFLGSLFIQYIEAYDHWVAFVLLLFIGGKMVFDGIKEVRHPEQELQTKKFSFAEVLVQGVATSIDALAVGLSMLAMEGITTANIWLYVSLIGVTTLCISTIGIVLGYKVGKLFRNKASVAEIIGGLVLIAIGLKILIEGLIA